MRYLKKEIKDLESEFIPLFECINNPMLNIYPNLPNSMKTITDCVFFYGVEGLDEDFDNTQINLKEYNPANKSHKFNLDYDLLIKRLDFEVFKTELKPNIDTQKNEFYSDLKKELEDSKNDISLKKKLADTIKSINQSIEALQKQSLNSIQLEVSKLYIVSYKKLINDLREEYSDYCPELVFNNLSNQELSELDSFNKYFEKQFINKFKIFEKKLKEFGYLDDDLMWLKEKIALVRFFKFCVFKGMIKPHYLERSDVLHFLEKRYSIDLGSQSKHSKFKKVVSFKSEYSFLD